VSGDLANTPSEHPVPASQPASQPAPSEPSARENIIKTLQSLESGDGSSAPGTQTPPVEEPKPASPETASTPEPEKQPAQTQAAATIVSLSQGQYLVKIDGAANKKIGIDVQVDGVSVQGSPFYF